MNKCKFLNTIPQAIFNAKVMVVLICIMIGNIYMATVYIKWFSTFQE